MRKRLLLPMLPLLLGATWSTNAQFVKQIAVDNHGINSEAYESVTHDGAWCWFADPRAVYHEGEHKRTYSTWVDSHGSIFVNSFDHETGEEKTALIDPYFQADDHNVPAILFDREGYITLFYTAHSGRDAIFSRKSAQPESIDQWGEVKKLPLNDMTIASRKLSTGYTYSHPIQLKGDNDNIYLYWRGMNFKPTSSVSKDGGKTWSKGTIVFSPRGKDSAGRPYTKIYSDGKEKIHFTCTDGHPRDEPTNNVYYFSYDKNGYKRADGTPITPIENSGISGKDADLVYDGSTKGKAWVWDVAQNKKGHPVIAFVRFPDDENHIYCRAEWTGKRWVVEDLVNSGGWFPKTPVATFEKEPNYSAGMSIDKENSDVLYASVKRGQFFEIEKWEKTPKGYKVEEITKNSTKDNVRPYAICGAGEKNKLQVMWMQNVYYHKFGNIFYYDGYSDKHYLTSIKCNIPQQSATDPMDNEQVLRKMKDVADWQLTNDHTFKTHHEREDWIWASFYVGLMELYKSTGDLKYLEELRSVGTMCDWEIIEDHFHADRMAIADVWLSLYELTGEERMIENVKAKLNAHLYRGFQGLQLTRKAGAWKWWSWCDALFMAPPAFAHAASVLDNPKYLHYMDKGWKHTADYLYSQADSLFYRDDTFFKKQTKNGKKVFWGRGNGWVIGGLVRVLDYLPKDSPMRAYYETQYKEMTSKLLSLQREDGLWTASLLDPEELSMSETSGSAFYTYGLLWGLNNGMIDQKHSDKVLKAWKTLVGRVDQRGCLGYVQKVAASPSAFSPNDWQLYASGAFLLAGKEFMEYNKSKE